MTRKTYYAEVEGFILGALRAPGDPVGELTEAEAKYLLMAGHVTDQKPAAKKAQQKAVKAEGEGKEEA